MYGIQVEEDDVWIARRILNLHCLEGFPDITSQQQFEDTLIKLYEMDGCMYLIFLPYAIIFLRNSN